MNIRVVPGADPPSEVRDDLCAEVQDPGVSLQPVEDLWLYEIDRPVGSITGRVSNLLVESGDDCCVVYLDDPASLGRERVEGHHGDWTAVRPLLLVEGEERLEVALAPVVSVDKQGGMSSEKIPVG